MKLTVQILLLSLAVLGFFFNLHGDINGRPAKSPKGFQGAVVSVLVLITLLWLYKAAGALSEIIGLMNQ